ncbi:hypothetical protein ACSSNL_12425 [Thalassobius sp. S69A]
MNQKETRVLGVRALTPRLTVWALTLIASAVSVPVAVILWAIEWVWW